MKYLPTSLISTMVLALSLFVSPTLAYEAQITSDLAVKTIELQALPQSGENAISVHIDAENIEIQSVEVTGNWVGPIGECANGATFTDDQICFSIAKIDTEIEVNEVIANITFSITDTEKYASLTKSVNSAYAQATSLREDYGILYEYNQDLIDATEEPSVQNTVPVTESNTTAIILIGLSAVLIIAFIVSYVSYRKHRSEKRKLVTLFLVLLLAVITLISGYLVFNSSKDSISDVDVSTTISCTQDSDCSETQFCNTAGSCRQKRDNNVSCMQDRQCMSNFCFITTFGSPGLCRPQGRLNRLCSLTEAECKANDNTRWCSETATGEVNLCFPKQYRDQVNCIATENHIAVTTRINDVCNIATSAEDINAEFIEQSGIPTSLTVGTTFTANLKFKNTGETSWSEVEKYRLGSESPRDNATWGVGRMSLGEVIVAPGEEYTFTQEFTAPTTPGTYQFQWMMVQDGVAWFGEASTETAIIVTSEDGDDDDNTPVSSNPCVAMDVGSLGTGNQNKPDGVIDLVDFANFARMMNKNCDPAPEFPGLSCGSIDSNANGKVDLVDFSKFAQLWNSTKTTKCAPAQSFNPNVCWNFAAGTTNSCSVWPNGCKGAKPASGTNCTQALVDLSANEKLQCNNWVTAGKPAIAGCN